MQITFIGTGTSHGVPVIGCHCPVCRSKDPRNKRNRSSILIKNKAKQVLIDTPPELRLQALKLGIERVDAVVLTHAHADHIHGFDDLRRFNHLRKKAIPCYVSPGTLSALKKMFFYIFEPTPFPYAKPQVILHTVTSPFKAGGIDFTPIPVQHGDMPIYGYRFGNTVYLTDVSSIPASSWPLLQGLDLLILGVLRRKPHPAHLSLGQALDLIGKLAPRRTLLTHLSHVFDHQQTERELPNGVFLAYDGMTVDAS